MCLLASGLKFSLPAEFFLDSVAESGLPFDMLIVVVIVSMGPRLEEDVGE